ncbi:MAG: hypothetical protein WD114_03405 [Phycisphaerales bacterium]
MHDSEHDLTPLVRDLIDRFFGESDRAEACYLISEYPSPFGNDNDPKGTGRERVQIACIKGAAGSLSLLAGAVDQANQDFRDVLMGAEFGSDLHAHLKWAHDQLS